MAVTKRNLFIGGSILLAAFAVLLWALLTGHMPKDKYGYPFHLPNDKNGYHYEYFNGQITKVRDFIPPPGTH